MELWRSYSRKGLAEAKVELVQRHLGLVNSLVRRVAFRTPARVDRSDLEAAGIYGLLKALDGFDPTRGAKLSSYCQLRIYGAIIDELRCQDWVSRPSRQRDSDLNRAKRELREGLERKGLSREASPNELAAHMGISLQELAQRSRESHACHLVSLDALGVGSAADNVATIDSKYEPLEVAHRRDLWSIVIDQLTVVERRLVDLHYCQCLKLKQVAKVLQVSSSRATQIHTELLQRLKVKLAQEAV